ncbi:hypothetical protein MYX07_03880 [Patescibacteria group bacterium AH-259-L07]|nr:hypothetical protein [Patescibacteria group bacterium AH-259-L07]
MAYEVKDWKMAGCSLTLRTSELSDREYFSREINEAYSEGGGLNADYQTVEAIGRAISILGVEAGLVYGEDFVWKTAGVDEISFDFATPEIKRRAENVLGSFLLAD